MNLIPIGTVAQNAWNRIKQSEGASYYLTGFPSLDRYISGLFEGQLVILAARPSFGKTALLQDIAFNVAKSNEGVPVVLFSMEMSRTDLSLRYLTKLTGIPYMDIATNNIGPEDEEEIEKALAVLDSLQNLYIVDYPNLTTGKVSEVLYELTMDGQPPPAMVGIDYLQIMGDYPDSPPHIRITNISKELKAIARDRYTCVVALSQLSRRVEHRLDNRGDPRPTMSDLRESGSLEQDADVILSIFNQDNYTVLHPGHQFYREESAGRREVSILKNRNGRIGTILFDFDENHMKFRDIGELE